MRGYKSFSDISKNRENYTLSSWFGPKVKKNHIIDSIIYRRVFPNKKSL